MFEEVFEHDMRKTNEIARIPFLKDWEMDDFLMMAVSNVNHYAEISEKI